MRSGLSKGHLYQRSLVADTAFSLFKSGRITLSGLGILNMVQEKEARITPLFIGVPDYPGSDTSESL